MVMLVVKTELLKTLVAAYTKKDGTFVSAHEHRVAQAHKLAEKIRAHGPEFEPHIEKASGGSVYLTVHKHPMTASGKRHASKKPMPMDYKARFADHGAYWGGTISVDPITGNTVDQAFAMFKHSADPKIKPEINSFNRSRIDPESGEQYVTPLNFHENIWKNGGKGMDYWRMGEEKRHSNVKK